MRAGREPCPVCGHPTGDCVGPERPGPVAPVRFGPVEVPPSEEPTILLDKDIWKIVQLTANTKTRVLVARAGAYIPVSLAEEYGVMPD